MDRKESYQYISDICEMKKKLKEWAKAEIDQGKEHVDTKEMGDAIDMIKDLAEAEKLCYEAMYYETVIDAMNESDDEEVYGYHGRRPRIYKHYPDEIMYKPFMDQEPYIDEYLEDRMGYSRGTNSGERSSGGNRGRSGSMGRRSGGRSSSYGFTPEDDDWDERMPMDHDRNERYGQAYNEYRLLKKHYTETGNKADKEEMSMKAQEHLADTMMTIRDIWKNADPDYKAKMKKDFQGLMSEMNI